MRRASKVDGNQPSIIKALRKIGASVEFIGQPLDLLVSFRGRTFLMECKDRNGKGQLTKGQIKFIERWPGELHVVFDVNEALHATIGPKAMQ